MNFTLLTKNDLSFRVTSTYSKNPVYYLEIVEWAENRSFCWTIATIIWSSEEPDLKFIGTRPFTARLGYEHAMNFFKDAVNFIIPYHDQYTTLEKFLRVKYPEALI